MMFALLGIFYIDTIFKLQRLPTYLAGVQ